MFKTNIKTFTSDIDLVKYCLSIILKRKRVVAFHNTDPEDSTLVFNIKLV